MASTQVTLKVTPHELQTIRAALRMYAYANAHMDREGYKHPLEGFQHDLSICAGDPRKATMYANEIIQGIGLK